MELRKETKLLNTMTKLREGIFELEQDLENGIKANVFKNCNTHSTAKAMLNAIKGFDFLIYQGESFNKLKDEIQELLRIFLNSVKI